MSTHLPPLHNIVLHINSSYNHKYLRRVTNKVIMDCNHLCYRFFESYELYHNHNTDTKKA